MLPLLSFVDGFSLPSVGGCNQHEGLLLVAAGAPGSRAVPRPEPVSGVEPRGCWPALRLCPR